MKILGISGGTKNGGNDSMCKEALIGAKSQGALVEFIQLSTLNIKHCTGCTYCVQAILGGKGNKCVIKDDFDWLLDKIYDADGILFSIPIFEKGASGLFRTLMDRFGPRMSRVHNIIADDLAKKGQGKSVDQRFLKDKVVSYMGIGGSEWTTRTQCDFGIQALTPMWKIIDNEIFAWSLGIIMDDNKLAKANQIGKNLALAAADIEHAEYQGKPGVCPHCHNNNFHLIKESTKAICCQCGIEGYLEVQHGNIQFVFEPEQLTHAHDTMEGQRIHANDITENTSKMLMKLQSDEYQKRREKYIQFISPLTINKLNS